MPTLTSKENLLRTIAHDRPEWVPDDLESVEWIRPPVIERPDRAGPDAFGVQWAFEAGAEGGTYPAADGHPIDDLAQWRDRIVWPDLDTLDWDSVAEQARAIDRDAHLVQGFVEMGLFERSYLLLGMDAALMAYLTRPDEMDGLLGALADYKIRLIERFDDAADLDMIWYGDDWGTQESLFLPPEVWRARIRPHTQRVYDCMKSRGISINQHSCGKIEDVLGDMIEMGVDLWNPCQPCNDLARLKRDFGDRITFVGGLDSQGVLGREGVSAEEVRAEVRRRIDEMADGGGYIAAPSHSVPYDPAVREAMHDEIKRYGTRHKAQRHKA